MARSRAFVALAGALAVASAPPPLPPPEARAGAPALNREEKEDRPNLEFAPSCDWTMVPHYDYADFGILNSSNGAPTRWEFNRSIRVSRTYRVGLGHPCWDQTLHFENVAGASCSPIEASTYAVLVTGTTTSVLGGNDTRGNDTNGTWAREPDAVSSVPLLRAGGVRAASKEEFSLLCPDGSGAFARATVTETIHTISSWSRRIRLVRPCPVGTWTHLSVNVVPPVPNAGHNAPDGGHRIDKLRQLAAESAASELLTDEVLNFGPALPGGSGEHSVVFGSRRPGQSIHMRGARCSLL